MADFQTQADVWRALLEGATVEDADGLRYRFSRAREMQIDDGLGWRSSSETFWRAHEFRLIRPEPTSGDYDWAVEQLEAGKMIASARRDGFFQKRAGVLEFTSRHGRRLGEVLCEDDGAFTLAEGPPQKGPGNRGGGG